MMSSYSENTEKKKIVSFETKSDLGSIIKQADSLFDFTLYERINVVYGKHQVAEYRIVTPLGGPGFEYTPDMMSSFGKTKRSIFLQNDYDSELFKKDLIAKSEEFINTTNDLSQKTPNEDHEGTGVFINKIYTEFINDVNTKKFTDPEAIKTLANKLLSEESKLEFNPTVEQLQAVAKILEINC